MPRRRMMSEKTDVVRRLRLGQSIRAISRETGTHRTVVRQLREVAAACGWLDLKASEPTEEQLRLDEMALVKRMGVVGRSRIGHGSVVSRAADRIAPV